MFCVRRSVIAHIRFTDSSTLGTLQEPKVAKPPDAMQLFETVGQSKDRIVEELRRRISKTRSLLLQGRDAMMAAYETWDRSKYEEMVGHYTEGTQLLMSTLDGLAVYVETRIVKPPTTGKIYWDGDVFNGPAEDEDKGEAWNASRGDDFKALKEIKDRTEGYGKENGSGLTVRAFRNFAKHYLAFLPMPTLDLRQQIVDVYFPGRSGATTGLTGLLFRVFNDAREAVFELARLLDEKVELVEELPLPSPKPQEPISDIYIAEYKRFRDEQERQWREEMMLASKVGRR